MARAVGVSPRTISKLCAGQIRQPAPEIVHRLAELLRVDHNRFTEGPVPLIGASVDWIAPDVRDALRRLEDDTSRTLVNNALRRILEDIAVRSLNQHVP